ncbi:cyclin-like protein interacting with PHO85, partial [Spiromyces aspiralis]
MHTFDLATTPTPDTVRLVASYLDECAGCSAAVAAQAAHPDEHVQTTSLTMFHARSIPTIDLYSYLHRILKYCPCQNEVFLSLVVYFRRIIDSCRRKAIAFSLDAYSIHRLIISGVTIASKWFSDVFFTNTRYAKVGGLHVTELNVLEIQFLSLIDFNAAIPIAELQEIGSLILHRRMLPLHPVPSYYITPDGLYILSYYNAAPNLIQTPRSALFESKFPSPNFMPHHPYGNMRRMSHPNLTCSSFATAAAPNANGFEHGNINYAAPNDGSGGSNISAGTHANAAGHGSNGAIRDRPWPIPINASIVTSATSAATSTTAAAAAAAAAAACTNIPTTDSQMSCANDGASSATTSIRTLYDSPNGNENDPSRKHSTMA